jgi:hypothetical protein
VRKSRVYKPVRDHRVQGCLLSDLRRFSILLSSTQLRNTATRHPQLDSPRIGSLRTTPSDNSSSNRPLRTPSSSSSHPSSPAFHGIRSLYAVPWGCWDLDPEEPRSGWNIADRAGPPCSGYILGAGSDMYGWIGRNGIRRKVDDSIGTTDDDQQTRPYGASDQREAKARESLP